MTSPSLKRLSGLSFALVLVACGGATFEEDEPGTSGGSGGKGASAGSTTGGSGGLAGGQGGTGGSGGCLHDGMSYQPGDSFPAGDGCNTCSCQPGGSVGCTLIACNVCPTVENTYISAVDEAKTCDPALAIDQCTGLLFAGLQCGCETFLNPAKASAIQTMAEAQQQYSAYVCGRNVTCGACMPPSSAFCNADGRCQDTWSTTGAEAACKVGGVVYESGSSGIPDPLSCNTCTCTDGELSCTELDCPSESCPAGATWSSQCAACGPLDGCDIVEYDCLPMCVNGETCANGSCITGVCRAICG